MTQNDTHTTHTGGFSPVLGESDPLIPFDVRDHNGRRGMYILLGSILALLALATIIFVTYQPGTRDRGEPPRIKADNQPFKVEPADPGGVQTPDQDKSVYDVMAGKTVDETVVTAPGAEEPIEMPSTANIQVDPPKSNSTVKTPAPKDIAPLASGPKANATVKTPAPKEIAPLASGPKANATVKTPAPKIYSAPVATGSGDYVVQVASVRSYGAATDVWNNVSTKFSGILNSGLYSDIAEVDLGDKGVFFRLRVAGLADKQAANQLCSQFKARGQACLVAKR